MPSESIADFVPAFLKLGRETAFVHRRGYRTVRWTYAEVAALAYRFARELDARQIARGQRVLLWGESGPEWVAVFLGCALRGVVVVPMDQIAAPEFAERVAAEVELPLAVVSRDIRPGPVVAVLPRLVLDDLSDTLAGRSGDAYAPTESAAGDPLEIVFTSGTTAEPKGVVLSHGNVVSNLAPIAREIEKYRKYERWFHPLRFMNALPLSHVFGQFLGIFIPHLLGATVFFPDSLNPGELIKTIKRERISVLIAVPRVLQSLKEKIERDFEAIGELEKFRREWAAADGKHFGVRWWRMRRVHNLFGWKFWAFISGGAALDAETEEFWRRMSFGVVQGYGLTETTSLISLNHPFSIGKKSIGKVLPGREVKLAEDGEILVRGAGVASGYWQGREVRAVGDAEGWFRTGDLGALDEQGNLYFKGRKKDVIVTPAGLNIYPADLEAALRAQPEVKDCVVIGLARGGNDEPCAVLLLQDRAQDPAAMMARANAGLADFQQMRAWFVWPDEDFPRTPTQKPRVNVVKDAVLRAQTPGNAADDGTLGDLITRITGRRADLRPDARLEDDLRLSSLDRVELLSAIEDRYQVDLSDSSLSSATTVGDLEKLLQAPAPKPVERPFPRWAQTVAPVRWVRNLVYSTVTWPYTAIMAKPTVVGRENLEKYAGPLLIVCNHVTYIDLGFVMYALPMRLRYRIATGMLGERLWAMRAGQSSGHRELNAPMSLSPGNLLRRWLNKLDYYLVLALFNVFPLPQQSGVRESFEFAGESADRGFSILVFPEGRRSETGELGEFRSGVGMLAQRLNLPVLPIRIDGLKNLGIAKRHWARKGEIVVRVGTPIVFDAGMTADEITQGIRDAVKGL
ncbi:AMP-dependent synthetase and ligase [Candidatus Koribacter versatilis Ellin345]|uniref:AMP-dependent synthetase and ligase n=1 Tax=Koribacter versatilis (strain Ellin345) TaxID=204669 RepID=Q1IMD0_KORVE|nr:AMP-binding protein [Candidatus Koribacter versatilis]ABF41970.1 AMP-dependent synthetase and ligase [Candidatus Koribacter versatilis Ellin345]